MRLVTIGSGTAVPDPDRASACHWVETDAASVIVDCGAGALQGLARSRLPWGRVSHLLISHFHADHIAEIPSLLFAMKHGLERPRRAPLDVRGPVGTLAVFRAWAQAFGDWVLDPGFDLEIEEVGPGDTVRAGDLSVTFADTPHTPESLAMRFEAAGDALGYTGDTGPSDVLGEFFRDVDLLLAECSLPEDLAGDFHLSPTSLARLAEIARTPRLAVTHVYPQLRRLDVEHLLRAAGYSGRILLVSDGLEIPIRSTSLQ